MPSAMVNFTHFEFISAFGILIPGIEEANKATHNPLQNEPPDPSLPETKVASAVLEASG